MLWWLVPYMRHGFKFYNDTYDTNTFIFDMNAPFWKENQSIILKDIVDWKKNKQAVYTLYSALRKLYFHFLTHWMKYDRGDSFLSNLNEIDFHFGSKSKGKLSTRSYPIQCERKWNTSFLSAVSISTLHRLHEFKDRVLHHNIYLHITSSSRVQR